MCDFNEVKGTLNTYWYRYLTYNNPIDNYFFLNEIDDNYLTGYDIVLYKQVWK